MCHGKGLPNMAPWSMMDLNATRTDRISTHYRSK